MVRGREEWEVTEIEELGDEEGEPKAETTFE